MDRLTYAKFYATRMHGSQMYGVIPYTHHLEATERILREFGPIPTGPWPKVGEQAMNRMSGETGTVASIEVIEMKVGRSLEIYTVRDEYGLSLGEWGDNRAVLVWPDPATPEDMYVGAWLHDVIEDTDAKRRDVEELFGDRVARLVSSVTSVDGPNRKVRNALTYPLIREAGPFSVRLKLADRLSHIRNGGGSVEMYRREQPDFRRSLHTPGENEDMWEALDIAFQRAV